MSELSQNDISNELWREYDFGGRVYRIENPVTLFMRSGGTTHRVVDSVNVTHCVPAPGVNGCVLRWTGCDGHGVKF
jgi:hypothetical protein